jgi:hypothetical protein
MVANLCFRPVNMITFLQPVYHIQIIYLKLPMQLSVCYMLAVGIPDSFQIGHVFIYH